MSEYDDFINDENLGDEAGLVRRCNEQLRDNQEWIDSHDPDYRKPGSSVATEFLVVVGAWMGFAAFVAVVFALAKLGGAA